MNRPNNAFQREGELNVSFLLADCIIWCVAVWLCCVLSLPFFFIPPWMLEPETSSSRYQNPPLTGNGVRRRNKKKMKKKEFVMLYAHFSQHKYLIERNMLCFIWSPQLSPSLIHRHPWTWTNIPHHSTFFLVVQKKPIHFSFNNNPFLECEKQEIFLLLFVLALVASPSLPTTPSSLSLCLFPNYTKSQTTTTETKSNKTLYREQCEKCSTTSAHLPEPSKSHPKPPSHLFY